MGGKAATCMNYCIILTLFASILAQAVGFFSQDFVILANCTGPGLLNNVSTNRTDECSTENISSTPIILEGASFVINVAIILLMIVIGYCKGKCCKDDNIGICDCCAGCLVPLYFISGVLSIVGCILVSQIPLDDFTYGTSFFLCLGSGIFNVLQVGFILCYVCKFRTRTGNTASGRTVAMAYEEKHEVLVSSGIMFVHMTGILRLSDIVR